MFRALRGGGGTARLVLSLKASGGGEQAGLWGSSGGRVCEGGSWHPAAVGLEASTGQLGVWLRQGMGAASHLSPSRGGRLPQNKSEVALSCWPGTLLPPAGHTAWRKPLPAILHLGEPCGQRCPFGQENQGIVTNLIKFVL